MPVLAGLTAQGANIPDEDAFALLKAAISAGVTCWNGADFYGTPASNSLHLLSRYFAAYPEDADKVVICIKTGVVYMRTFSLGCSPQAIRNFVANANSILGGKKKIDIFSIARVDPKVPVEDTMKTLAELVSEGTIGGIQLREVGPETIRRAANVAKIDMVEAEVSLWALVEY
ncbi:hypothetical protein CIB48_g4431 [Xylaria polymorpha]|nr:hypothetical protein CIB48_g4431 [Xylaria polymorpha]